MRHLGLALVVGAVLACSGLSGCGSDGGGGGGESGAISEHPLSGKIGGIGWTFATGETNAFLSMGTTFFVDLYGAVFTACGGGAPVDGNTFIFQIPKAAGDYPLGLTRNATFYDAATAFNRVATRGHIRIDGVTATTITGGANVTFDAGNTADGTFQATICP